jgi:hypothetical protein
MLFVDERIDPACHPRKLREKIKSLVADLPEDYVFLHPGRLDLPSIADHQVVQERTEKGKMEEPQDMTANDLMDEHDKILLRPGHRSLMEPYMGERLCGGGGLEGGEEKGEAEEGGTRGRTGSDLRAPRGKEGMTQASPGAPNVFYIGSSAEGKPISYSNVEYWEQCGDEQRQILCGLASSVRDKMLRLCRGGGGRGTRGSRSSRSSRSSSSASASEGGQDGGASGRAEEEPEVAANKDIESIKLSTMSWDLSAYEHSMRAVVQTTRTLRQKIAYVGRRNAYVAPDSTGGSRTLKMFAAKEDIVNETIEHERSNVTFTFKFPKRAVGIRLTHRKLDYTLMGNGE